MVELPGDARLRELIELAECRAGQEEYNASRFSTPEIVASHTRSAEGHRLTAACLRALIAVRELMAAKDAHVVRLETWYNDPMHADAEDRPAWMRAATTLRREIAELRALVAPARDGGGGG